MLSPTRFRILVEALLAIVPTGVNDFARERGRSRAADRGTATVAERMGSAVPGCELCDLKRTTRWYAQFHHPVAFTVIDCDSCDVPMAVLAEHRTTVTAAERAAIERALALVAESVDLGEVFFDDRMRQIPDHYHMHVRPRPGWWPRP
jgi:hypothetical protein